MPHSVRSPVPPPARTAPPAAPPAAAFSLRPRGPGHPSRHPCGKTFDPNRVNHTVTLGTVEEWVLPNPSPDWHPFHIDVNDFQVVAVDGRPVRPRSGEDTVGFPPNGGEFMIRTHGEARSRHSELVEESVLIQSGIRKIRQSSAQRNPGDCCGTGSPSPAAAGEGAGG